MLLTALTCAALAAFGPLAEAFHGALWNPVHVAAMIAAGAKDSLGYNILRMVRVRARAGCVCVWAVEGASAAVASVGAAGSDLRRSCDPRCSSSSWRVRWRAATQP